MRWIVIPLLFISALFVEATEPIQVPPWEFHSSFWMNLHQTLMTDAMRSSSRDLKTLKPEEQTLS